MAVWSRKWRDKRTYFNIDGALVKDQESELVIRLFGIPIIERSVSFKADSAKKDQNGLGFKNAK